MTLRLFLKDYGEALACDHVTWLVVRLPSLTAF